MSDPNGVPSKYDNLVTSLKVGVCLTVAAWMVLAIEAPQLVAAPEITAASVASVKSAAPTAVDYFPAQFPAPKGEPEPAPVTF